MSILITGANRGIGRELASRYAASGKHVIATTRGHPPADMSAGIEWHQLDVTDAIGWQELARALGGRAVSLLICNAGVFADKGDALADGFAPETWRHSMDVNVMAPFLAVQTLLPNLKAADGAKVAIIASKMGSNSAAGGGAYIYRASKAAAINLASNLAPDLAPFGISIGAYHPGWVRTDMGGAQADIDAASSAKGLMRRFAALSPATTGCFEAHDGTALPY